MSPEKEWGKIFFCHNCRKYLDDETGMSAHIQMGHQANSFISMPKDAKTAPVTLGGTDTLTGTSDYAESLEVEGD